MVYSGCYSGPREIEDNAYANFWGATKMYRGSCTYGELQNKRKQLFCVICETPVISGLTQRMAKHLCVTNMIGYYLRKTTRFAVSFLVRCPLVQVHLLP